MERKEYTDDDIVPLDPAEWIKRRVFQNAEIDDLYVIMGSLQEYFGGYHWDEETVDMFFVNEFEQAKLFHGVCRKYLAELNAESDLELIKIESGHSYLRSKLICEKLKAQYVNREADFLNHKCYRLSTENDLFKSPEALYGDWSKYFNFKRYSYLLGAMLKNKTENEPVISFANAGHKAELIIDILKEFRAFGDETFRVDYYFNTPYVTRIILSENNAIWPELERYKGEVMKGMG